MPSSFLRPLLILLPILTCACSTQQTVSLPADFSFVMDVRTSKVGSPNNIHITIDSKGRGRYEVYDTGGVIQYDQNEILTYGKDQVLSTGKFSLSPEQQESLWTAIHQNQFFDLTEDYRMAIGHSFAFIMIKANGKRHIVDNIGMEVPQIRALVEATDALMPEELDLKYGEGYIP